MHGWNDLGSTVKVRTRAQCCISHWNSLPNNVISAPSPSTFRQRLKNISVSGLVSWHYHYHPRLIIPHLQWILKWFYYLDHSKNAWLIDCLIVATNKHDLPRWDSNPGTLTPQSDALTTWPLRHDLSVGPGLQLSIDGSVSLGLVLWSSRSTWWCNKMTVWATTRQCR